MILESEIGFAILYCSTTRYCNPSAVVGLYCLYDFRKNIVTALTVINCKQLKASASALQILYGDMTTVGKLYKLM